MRKKLLIVDDSPIARRIFKRTLPAELEMDLLEAGSGTDAIARCLSEPPDLVFLDLTMPTPDGYQVLAELKAAQAMPKVVILSGDIQPQAQARTRSLGAIGFLMKPAGREDLREVLVQLGFL